MNRIRGFGRFGAAAVAALLLTQTGTAGFPAVQAPRLPPCGGTVKQNTVHLTLTCLNRARLLKMPCACVW